MLVPLAADHPSSPTLEPHPRDINAPECGVVGVQAFWQEPSKRPWNPSLLLRGRQGMQVMCRSMRCSATSQMPGLSHLSDYARISEFWVDESGRAGFQVLAAGLFLFPA